MVIDIAKSNPGATAVEQPADQDGFRDVKKLLRRMKSSTPDEELLFLVEFASCWTKSTSCLVQSARATCVAFSTHYARRSPLCTRTHVLRNNSKLFFGPDPLKPSLQHIVRGCIGWQRLLPAEKLSYIEKAPFIVDKFKARGFATEEDWKVCPWDPEFDQHRDDLSLSHQVCLHVNHEGSRKKREEEEKKALEMEKKAPKEKKKGKEPKKPSAVKKKEVLLSFVVVSPTLVF